MMIVYHFNLEMETITWEICINNIAFSVLVNSGSNARMGKNLTPIYPFHSYIISICTKVAPAVEM